MLRANGLPEAVIINESNRSSKVESKTSSAAIYSDNENPVLRHRSKRVTTKRFTKVYESPNASNNEEYTKINPNEKRYLYDGYFWPRPLWQRATDHNC